MRTDILSNLVITRVFSATTMYTEKNTKTQKNNRPGWAVVIKYEGETIYKCNGREFISNVNTPVILPKGCSYEWCCTESGHFSIIEFECELTCNDIMTFTVTNGDKILTLFKEMEYKNEIKKSLHTIESIRDVYSIILKIAQNTDKKYIPTDKQTKLKPAVEYIIKNFNRDITNDELADIAGVSTVYFRKMFRDVFGISPISYVQNLRIKKAKEMLKSDYGSITQIALSLGYNNIYDFSRAFKKHTGVSPTKYI